MKTSATPSCFSSSMSSFGIVPPTTSTTSSAPSSLSSDGDARHERHVRAREDREAHGVGVLLEHRLDDLLGRLVEAGVDDLHARVAQRAGDDLGAAVVAVQARLGHDDADLPAGHGRPGYPRATSRCDRRGAAAPRGRGGAPRRPAGASARPAPAARPSRCRCSAATVRRRSGRPRRRTSRRPWCRRVPPVSPVLESGVSPPLCEACTTTVPCMFGWGVQMYENVPASLKVCERLCPAGKIPVSKLPSGAVAECAVGPSFVQVTVSPWLIVICAGANWKSEIVTEPLAAALALTFCLRSRAGCSAGAGAAGCSGAAAGCSGAGAGAAGSGAAAGSPARAPARARAARPGSPRRAPSRRPASPRPPDRRPRMRTASLEARAPRSGRRPQQAGRGASSTADPIGSQTGHASAFAPSDRGPCRGPCRVCPCRVLAATLELDVHAVDRAVVELQNELAAATRPVLLGLPEEHVRPAAALGCVHRALRPGAAAFSEPAAAAPPLQDTGATFG